MAIELVDFKLEPATVSETVSGLVNEYTETLKRISVAEEQLRIIDSEYLAIRNTKPGFQETEMSLEATLKYKQWSDEQFDGKYNLQYIIRELKKICLPADVETSDRWIVVNRSFSFRFIEDQEAIEIDN